MKPQNAQNTQKIVVSSREDSVMQIDSLSQIISRKDSSQKTLLETAKSKNAITTRNTLDGSQKNSMRLTDSLSQIVSRKTVSQKPLLTSAKSKNNIIKGNYLGSECEGNYVWAGAMNLAWNELNSNILHGNLQMNTTDKTALKMVDCLNQPVFAKKDLDEKSYYVKSGYGQKTVDLINQESKKRFPSKRFGDLQLKLSPTDIISYAYFLKEVKYKTPFSEENMFFEGKKVESFYAKNAEQRKNIEVLQYENDNKFIIRLSLKDESDQLILAKGFDMNDPNMVLAAMRKSNTPTFLKDNEQFKAPVLHLSHNRVYNELLGKSLANKGFEQYFIAQMFENIKFDMDSKGARAENEAVVMATKSADIAPSRHFILDKPYWVVMKRSDSQNPYLFVGVKNVNVMKVLK